MAYGQRFRARARGGLRERGKMNKGERALSEHFERLKLAGKIQDYRFQPIKLRLADNTFLEIDFMVIGAQGEIIMVDHKPPHDKGRTFYATDDAKVKLKVAAEIYPYFYFKVMWQPDRKSNQWKEHSYE